MLCVLLEEATAQRIYGKRKSSRVFFNSVCVRILSVQSSRVESRISRHVNRQVYNPAHAPAGSFVRSFVRFSASLQCVARCTISFRFPLPTYTDASTV